MRKRTGLILFGAFVSFGMVAAVMANANKAIETKATDPFVIDSLEDFQTVFDGNATYNNRDIDLVVDLDVSGIAKRGAAAMAGTYTGTFRGNGHLISGFNGPSGGGCLFNAVGSAGTVQDLVLHWIPSSVNTGGLGYTGSGTFTNVSVISEISGSSAESDFGGLFYTVDNTASFANCYSHFVTKKVRGGAVHAISRVNAEKASVTNCYYSDFIDTEAGTAALSADGFTKINSYSASAPEIEVSVGRSTTLTGTMGVPLSFVSSDDSVASVSGCAVTGVAAGDATITGTIKDGFADYFSGFSYAASVSVSSGTVYANGATLSDTSLSLSTGDEKGVSLTIDNGGEYESIAWTTDSESVATVSGNDKSATITAVGSGSTTITATITVGDPGNTTIVKEISVEVTDPTYEALPVSNESTYKWVGTGLQKVRIVTGADGIGTANEANFDFSVNVTGTMNSLSLAGWNFQEASGNTVELYFHFTGAAPAANSGVYTLHLTLSTKASPKTIYTADIMFDGLTKVTPAVSISGSNSLTVGGNESYTAGFSYVEEEGATYNWSVSPAGKATLSATNTKSVTLTGVAAGNVTLGLVVTDASGNDYAVEKAVEVVSAAADVNEIALSIADDTILEENQTTVSASLTGQLYNSFEWQSLNTSVATVSGGTIDGVTVTGVAAGSTSIKMIVHTDSGDVQQTVGITVTAALRTKVYAAVPHSFAYGGAVTIFGGNAIEYKTLTTDTGFDITYGGTEYDLVVADINLTKAGKANNGNTDIIVGVHAQMEQAVGIGRYGNGIAVSTKDGLAFVVNGAGDEPYASLGTGAEMEGVLNFCKNYMKSDTIALDNGDSTEDCKANYGAAKAALVGLNAAQKVMFTYTAYYERLQNWASANSETLVIDGEGQIQSAYPVKIQSTSDNGGAIALVAITMIAMASFAGYALYFRKRKAE